MTNENLGEDLRETFLIGLTETFEEPIGIYLDRGTSMFQTLATISAEEASRPVSANCASIAAQVAHVTFYLELMQQFVRGEYPEVNWNEIWETVEAVTPEEWEASQQALQAAYQAVRGIVEGADWSHVNQVRGAMGLLLHNAYHLGEIRQALCTVQQNR